MTSVHGLWPLAAAELGMREDDFWASTPRSVVAALERARGVDESRERAAYLRAGRLCAAVYAAGGLKKLGGLPFGPGDFFPGVGLDEAATRQTDDEMLGAMMLWHQALTGESQTETM